MVNFTNNSLGSAFIGINKNRLKTYADGYNAISVYLKDKADFQIELFNPTKGSLLAKIKLNGEYISQKGLVLKPGERVWLDRYIDENKKFQFSTYEVESGDYQVDNAIRENGLVEVEFYDEKIQDYSGGITWNPNDIFYSNTGTIKSGSFGHTTTTNDRGGFYGNTSFTSSVLGDYDLPARDFLNLNDTQGPIGPFATSGPAGEEGPLGYQPKSKETGRVEKGNASTQSFNEVDMEFNLWVTNTVTYKIVPESYLNLTSDDVRVKYCTNCGKKITKTAWKFCPDCGEKI